MSVPFVPMSIPSPDVRSWTIEVFGFELTIHIYAICILAGIVAATLLTNHRLNKRGAEKWVVIDIALPAVILGILGARIYHVLTHPNDYFGDAATQTWWNITEGGIAIFGALLGGAVGALIGCRYAGIRFWTFADALAPGLLLAQAFGRLGNWFNHELFGLPTDAWWGLEIEKSNPVWPSGLPEGTLFHPTFLYEIIWNLAGVALLLWVSRAFQPQWGRLFGLYLVWYGFGRSYLESIRIDPSEVFLGLRVNIWGAFAAILVGIVIIWVQGRRHPGIEPSPYTEAKAEQIRLAAIESENAALAASDEPAEPEGAETGADSATSESHAPQ